MNKIIDKLRIEILEKSPELLNLFTEIIEYLTDNKKHRLTIPQEIYKKYYLKLFRDLFKIVCKYYGKPDSRYFFIQNRDEALKEECFYQKVHFNKKEQFFLYIIDCLIPEYSESRFNNQKKTKDEWIKNIQQDIEAKAEYLNVIYRTLTQDTLNRIKKRNVENNIYGLLNEVLELGACLALSNMENSPLEINRRIEKSLKQGNIMQKTNKQRANISKEDAKAYLEDYFTRRLEYPSDMKFYKSLADGSITITAIKKAIQRLLEKEPTLNNKFKDFKKKHKLK